MNFLQLWSLTLFNKIIIFATVPSPVVHPIHYHGYLLQLLEVGFGNDYKKGNPVYRNLTRPAPLKDTILVPSGGYAIARFRTTNPGYWFLHCHVEMHMLIGMRAIVKVGDNFDMVLPPHDFPTCGNFPM